jgi:DNA end-binding protein Ku
MPRPIWKGSISFGLVHVPVALHPATRTDDIDFDWLDQRSMAPIGYRRVNKDTGREVDRKFIVRGYEYRKGRYVVLSDEEIRAANARATQTVELLCFADLREVSFLSLETPYFLAPGKGGGKVYALLREALKKTGRIGIAHVVLHTRQHLAALIPSGPALVLNTLRWSGELRDMKSLELPAEGANAAGIRDEELSMAQRLIEDMTEPLHIGKYKDTFRDDILALVRRKVKAGKTEVVEHLEAKAQPAPAGNVIDVTELLKRSLHGGGAPGTRKRAAKSRRRNPPAASHAAPASAGKRRRAS